MKIKIVYSRYNYIFPGDFRKNSFFLHWNTGVLSDCADSKKRIVYHLIWREEHYESLSERRSSQASAARTFDH